MSDDTIRIGILLDAGEGTADAIRQRLPHGFESFSLSFPGSLAGMDLRRLAGRVKETLAGTDAVISSLALFANPLLPNDEGDQARAAWRKLIDAAPLFGCDIVAGFTGRIPGQSIPESIRPFTKVFRPLADRALDRGVRIAFENCTRTDAWHTGSRNIALTPDSWELIFNALPTGNIGLEWEPCHQMVELIDPMPQLRKHVARIFHVHGKDATIYWDVIREHGIGGLVPYVFHRTPGFGDSNWTDIISELRRGGFKGSVDIEAWHDPVYRGELEMTGQVAGLDYLKRCRAAKVPCPT